MVCKIEYISHVRCLYWAVVAIRVLLLLFGVLSSVWKEWNSANEFGKFHIFLMPSKKRLTIKLQLHNIHFRQQNSRSGFMERFSLPYRFVASPVDGARSMPTQGSQMFGGSVAFMLCKFILGVQFVVLLHESVPCHLREGMWVVADSILIWTRLCSAIAQQVFAAEPHCTATAETGLKVLGSQRGGFTDRVCAHGLSMRDKRIHDTTHTRPPNLSCSWPSHQ